MMRSHTMMEGCAARRCVKCHRLLLYGMFVGVLRCPSCKYDNRVTLDEFMAWLHNSCETTIGTT